MIAPSTNLVLGIFSLRNEVTIRHTKNWPRQTFQIWTPASVTLWVPSLLLLSVFTRLLPTPHYPARPVRLGSCGLSDACLGYVTEMHWSWRPGKKLYRDKSMSSHHRIFTWAINVNDLINARGVYLILEVQADERRLKQREAFILTTTTSTTKLVRFRQKKSREFKNRGISTPSVDTSRPFNHPYRFFKFQHRCSNLTQGYCVAIVSLSLLWTWHYANLG